MFRHMLICSFRKTCHISLNCALFIIIYFKPAWVHVGYFLYYVTLEVVNKHVSGHS